jgi:hypothetical protein
VAFVAASAAALALTLSAYGAATPSTVREAKDVTWSEQVQDEAKWRECVDAAWYNDDPSDATLFACDEQYGDQWVYDGPTYQEELTK